MGPLTFIVCTLASLVVGVVIVGALFAVFGSGSGVSAFGFGDPDVCVDVPQGAFGIAGDDSIGEHVPGLQQGITQTPDRFVLCRPHASTGEHLLNGAGQLVEFAFFVGFLIVCALLIRAARRHGLFTEAVARWLTRLGGYLLVGELVTAFVVAWLHYELLSGMTRDGHAPTFTALVSLSWPVIVAGFGVLSAGRVLAGSAQLQQEIDTLV